jgi:uncharacterized protein YggE
MFKRLSRVSALGLAVTLVALASACTTPAGVGVPDRNFRTITVNGTGIALGSPDIATADISVVTRNEDVQPASDENTRLMAAVLAALQGLGVEDKDLRTSNYSIAIEQPVGPDGTLSETREYVIANTVTVTFRDLSIVGEALQAAIAAGANQVSNIVFNVEDTSVLGAEARASAMADARSRADQLAEAAGVEIDVPHTINESYSFIPLPYARELAFAESADAAQVAPVPVQTGQITVQVDVTVTYLIR